MQYHAIVSCAVLITRSLVFCLGMRGTIMSALTRPTSLYSSGLAALGPTSTRVRITQGEATGIVGVGNKKVTSNRDP
jgi:hypothetical protein